jgi:UDP-GlcNAc3NAcA epimerase
MLVLSVVGARPQFVKAAPLSLKLRVSHREFMVHTGQHYDENMSDIFFQQLGIPAPDVNLGVGSGSHAYQTASMLLPLERLMQEQKPDWVLVYGDTNSTLAAALAAAKLSIPIAHVEAGLRSYNRAMPEEINRVMTDHLSQLLLCPTQAAMENLAREGIVDQARLTGDIMVDSVLHYGSVGKTQSQIHQRLQLHPDRPYAVVTIHRPSNTDFQNALTGIVTALNKLDMPVVFPAHPRTHKMLDTFGLRLAEHIQLTEPLGYLDMIALVSQAEILITDSGGLQKEAYVLETPCVTIRTETEWVETVESGWNHLCLPEEQAIRSTIAAALLSRPATHPDFYGDGHTAERIVKALETAF